MGKGIKYALVALACIVSASVNAQTEVDFSGKEQTKLFGHLDLGISLGSTGIGVNLTSHINKTLHLRAAFTFLPHITSTTDFTVRSGNYDKNGKWVSSDINEFIDLLEEITGFVVDNKIYMRRQPRLNNFSMMLDVYPFHKKNWHATVGFYVGNSVVGTAENVTDEMTALVSVGFYNAIYEKVINDEPIYKDAYIDPEIGDRMMEYGRMGIRVGDFVSDGTAYLMEPDENNMVSAKVKVNKFKPYFGVGYSGRLIKGDDRFGIAVDCGLMTWGGTPDIYTHDGTNLVKDVRNVTGKVGHYVHTIEKVKVYPVLSVTFTRKLF